MHRFVNFLSLISSFEDYVIFTKYFNYSSCMSYFNRCVQPLSDFYTDVQYLSYLQSRTISMRILCCQVLVFIYRIHSWILQTKVCSIIHAWYVECLSFTFINSTLFLFYPCRFSVFSTLWKIACNSVDDINFKYKIIPITKLDSTTGHMVKDVKRCFAETMVLTTRSSIYVGLFVLKI